MTKEEIENFRAGYDECRRVVIYTLRRLLEEHSEPHLIPGLLLKTLEQEEETDHWCMIQEEMPGISREEYTADLDAAGKKISERFRDKSGSLRRR